MDIAENYQAILTSLEDLLVREFRTYQSLVLLTRDERTSLASGDIHTLMTLVEQKDELLDDLMRLEDSRARVTEAWVDASGFSSPSPTIADMLPELDSSIAGRFGRLREGILALVEDLRELTHGNTALVNMAMERVDAVRFFLMNLGQPEAGYQPPGVSPSTTSPAVWEVEHWA